MQEELRNHIEKLFEYAPKTRQCFDLKEELMANSMERYRDLTLEGISPQDAYENVIGSIGNVNDLLSSLSDPYITQEDISDNRSRHAIITSICVGLYIFAGMVFFAIAYWGFKVPAIIVGLGICIIPTCILVYSGIMYPTYKRQDNTLVEKFKEWNNEHDNKKAVRGSISTIIWMLCLIAYFLISFLTGAWHITWILFLVATCIEGIVTLIFQLK